MTVVTLTRWTFSSITLLGHVKLCVDDCLFTVEILFDNHDITNKNQCDLINQLFIK